MIYDLLEVFTQAYTEKGDKLILDNYQLKDGLYVKINKDETVEYYLAQTVKKAKTFSTLEGNVNHTMHEWFKERDYYSNILDTSKAYDAPKKTIHNNNYLTLFMKIEEFLNVEFSYIEEKLFKKVFSFKSFDSKNEKKILKNYCHIIKPFSRKKELINIFRILKQRLDPIKIIASEYSPKEYIRIFFDKELDTYKNESSVYLALKIFNDNKYSIEDTDGIVYGLSNFNMGLNSKKPYLAHTTKKLSTPFMLTSEMALNAKLFSDWISLQKYQTDLLPKMYLNRHSDNGKLIINDFDYLPIKIDRLPNPIPVINHLGMTTKKIVVDDFRIESLSHLEAVADEILYNHQLIYNYYGDVYNKLDTRFANLIYMTRDAMVNYFRKYDAREFYQVINRYGTHFVTEHLRQEREYKAKESMNLILSLKHHQGETIMDIKKMQENVLMKLETSDYSDISDTEFFYLCGQVAKYLLSQSEAHTKNADMLEPYLRCNNAQKLKKSIEADFFNYKHKIPLGYVKFGNALSIIMSYDKEEKLSYWMDSFLVGVLSQNIFYMKKEEKKGEE
ncbi:MAG: hypothetical protein WA080_10405 [Sulfuricurvum sp.]